MTVDVNKKGDMAPNFKSQIENAKSIANCYSGVAEFSDNSMDVLATKIKFTSSVAQNNTFDLYISDNGTGMSYETLVSSMKLGSSRKDNRSSKVFGCKGVGMKTAATALADDSMEVYSKIRGSKTISYGKFDLKTLKTNPNRNDWNSLYQFDKLEGKDIQDTVVSNFLESVASGTVVILRKMNKKRCGTKKKFDDLMSTGTRGLGRIYRHILQDRDIQLFYNSSIIQSQGPGFDLKDKYQDKIFFEDKYKNGWITGVVNPWGTSSFQYRFRFVRVANRTGLGTSAQTGGLSIMRNGREVTSQLIAHIRPKNFAIGNLIIELDAPSEFLDVVLTFNGDKQIRTLENATEFDFRHYFKREFNKYWSHIIEINLMDSEVIGSSSEKLAGWKHNESMLVDRYYETQKEALRANLTDEEIESTVIKEYQIPGTGFKLDLVVDGLPFEFKVNGDDVSRTVGQILSYAPYLIRDSKFKFVKNNILRFKLAVANKPTKSLIRHIDTINTNYKLGDVRLNIELFDMTVKCPKLLEYPASRKEKNKLKKIA